MRRSWLSQQHGERTPHVVVVADARGLCGGRGGGDAEPLSVRRDQVQAQVGAPGVVDVDVDGHLRHQRSCLGHLGHIDGAHHRVGCHTQLSDPCRVWRRFQHHRRIDDDNAAIDQRLRRHITP